MNFTDIIKETITETLTKHAQLKKKLIISYFFLKKTEHEMCPSYKHPYDTCLTGSMECVPHTSMQYY